MCRNWQQSISKTSLMLGDLVEVLTIHTNIGILHFGHSQSDYELREAVQNAIAPILIKRAQELEKKEQK